MKFPVDLLAGVSQDQLEKSAHKYLNTLHNSNRGSPECLTLPDSTQVTIDISRVAFTPLYGQSDKRKILALFSPSDIMVAIGLYLLDRWWTVEDILKTADPARRGVLPVDTVGERIVLYILNRVIYRKKERSSEEIPFLCHGEKDSAKVLWDDGEAVGFYSVKATGSLYNRSSIRTYQLPVMDSIFVRKCHRGKGSGLLMLRDFVLSFPEDSLGLKFPLSKSMYRVCERYLCQYPEDRDLLWEVEGTGGLYQRTSIASKIKVKIQSAVTKRLSFTEESYVMEEVPDGDAGEDSITKGTEASESATEMMEETTVLRTTKGAELPVTGRRLSGSRRGKLEEEDPSGTNIRVEHIAAGAPREDQGSVQQETPTLHLQTGEAGGDASVATSVAEEAWRLTQSHQDLGCQHRLNLSPATEELQDEKTQEEGVAARGSPATAENVMLESEEAKEDAAGLLWFEEVCELHTGVETLKQGEQEHVLGRKNVLNATTVEGNYTQHSQKVGGETEQENTLSQVDMVAVAGTPPRETADMSDDAVALEKGREGERQQLEDEELDHDEQTEKKEEFDVKGTLLEEISAEHPDPAEPANTGVQLPTEGLQLEEGHVSEDEAEEPPGDQRRGPRGRRKVPPNPRTSATELLAVVEDDRAEEKVITSTEGRVESREVDTKETAPEMDPEQEEVADDGAEDRDVMTAADLHQPTVSVQEDHGQTQDGEIPTLQRASVLLVDLKTTSSRLKETSDVQLIAAERMDQKPEPASSEEGTEEPNGVKEASGNEGKEQSSHWNHEEEEEEGATLIETLQLRSGRKIVKVGRQEQERDDQEHEAELVPAETKEETQALTKDGGTGEDPADKGQEEESAEEASAPPEINKDMRLEEDEAAVAVNEKKTPGEDGAEAPEKQTNVPPEVDDGPVTLAEDQQNTADLTSPATVQTSNPEDTSGASQDKRHEEETDPQGSDLQRGDVVLVDLGNSSRSQEEREEEPAEMEEQNVKEALREGEEGEAAADGPGKAPDVPEEAGTTQTPQSVGDDEAQGVSADQEVPLVERRILRSGRKMGSSKGRSAAAAATPRSRSKRALANQEPEEQGAEEAQLDLGDVPQEDLSQEGEVKEKDDGVGAAEKEDTLQPPSEEDGGEEDEEDEETSREEPSIIARKTKRSAPATSRRKSKRSRVQRESEEEEEEDRDVEENESDDGETAEIENRGESVDQEEDEPEAGDKEMDVLSEEGSERRPSEQEENSLREASAVPSTVMLVEEEEEAAPGATPHPGSHGNGVNATPGTKALKHQMEENQRETLLGTGSGPGQPGPGEIAALKAEEQGNEAAEREEEELEEEAPASEEEGLEVDAQARAAESEDMNAESPAEIRVLNPGTDVDGTRTGMEEETTVTDVETPSAAAEEGHQAGDDAGWSEVPGLEGHQPSAFSRAKEAELSDTDESVASDLVTMETDMNLEPNTDEDEKESTSEEEEELPDDDGGLIVIGKKVLRGRTVPAVIRKRKRPDHTAARQSKRRSRV